MRRRLFRLATTESCTVMSCDRNLLQIAIIHLSDLRFWMAASRHESVPWSWEYANAARSFEALAGRVGSNRNRIRSACSRHRAGHHRDSEWHRPASRRHAHAAQRGDQIAVSSRARSSVGRQDLLIALERGLPLAIPAEQTQRKPSKAYFGKPL